MSNILDTLITDRTGGYYNASDLNRVGTALNYVRDELNNDCGYNLTFDAKTTWAVTDNPTITQMDDYLDYVENCRSAANAVPSTPDSMRFLTAQKANDIEKILLNCDTLIQNIKSAWYYSGELFSGEVV